ncbi:hypothetical protein O3P69_020823 [Scylla paramamosain]|uniref:Uncharacterized protein n=1 Tax=Scylla paramamosain TaxID=85552 RepID=A0AAW0TR31_SCYPA
MPTRKHAPLRSRDTWHGWSPSSRFSSIKLPGSRSRSTRSHDMRFSSTRSYDPRHYSIRSRASLNPSVRGRSSLRSLASRASSTLHRSFRHTGPIYRVATSRARAAREWAGTFREQISSKGGTLLLTPARGRRQPEVVATRGSPTPEPARNSPWVHATRRAASASRTVHWEVASGLAALFECGATAGSAAAVGVGRVCSAAAAMADGKLQQLRRSISSWSLSTVKKPKITVPKFKAPKIKAFRGKRNRVEPKDDAAALEEVKAALLKAEGEAEDQGSGAAAGETSSEVIHEPLVDGSQEGQPTIVLTVHEHKNPPEPPSPPPSPGLLAVNDDFEYIDSDEGDTDDRVIEAVRPDLDYSDQWFDAHGTLTRSKEDMVDILNGLDDDQVSKYYDFVDYTAPKQEKPETPPKDKPVKGGSQKARDWVKSFDEKAESRIQKLLKFNKSKTSSNLPKSKSEIRLDQIDDVPEKWSKRDEIKLNTLSKDASLQDKGQKLTPEKDKSSRKENLKKIFQVRGKLSIKPIVDSQRPSYTNTDIHIAAAPYALANTSATAEKTESLDVSEDGLNCTSDDLYNTNEGGPRSSTPQQHVEASAPSPPSSPIKQDASEITRESKVATVLDVSNDKQLGEGIFEKEATETIETPHPQSQDVLAKDTTNITITSVEDKTNSTEGTMDSKTCLPLSQVTPVQDNKASTIINLAGNQTKSMKEVTDANKAFPSQSHDAPAHNNAADTMINAAGNLLKSTEEVTDDRSGSAPQARAVSVQNATTNNVTNSSGNQMKATKEVIDDGKACPSQPEDAPVQDTTTNITTNDTEQQAQAAVHDERKPVEENIKCATTECKETDTESKTDLFKSTPGENANFSEQPEQRSVDAREPKEEKEALLATQEPNGVDSTELPKTETKETKKSKFSGNNFPKSIKNFAGSVFSPQFGGKAKTELKGNDSGDKKKKKGRLNPFSKESLFKSSVKEKSDSLKEIPQKEKETKDSDKTEGEKLSNKNNFNPFEDDEENPPCDEAPSPPENNNDSVEAKRDAVIVEDSTLCATTSDLPDVLHSNGISSTGRTSRSSSISLEFVSQVDSDEMKTVSHESSPEMDSSFVEEDGLRLRKDALLAIKAMDIDPDDTNTQFYSFASAVEDFQAPRREEDLQPTASTKKLPEPTAEPKIQEAETNKLQRKEEKTTEKMQEESPQKLRESLTQEKEKTPEKKHLESPQKRSESLTREEGRSEKKHESQQQLSDSSTNIRSSEEIAIKTDSEEENLQRKMNKLNKRNNEEVTSQNLINGPSTTVPDTPSKQESPPRCVQTASEPTEEIPKLKLDPATPSECQEAPRPSPRTKKGRYGYSTVGTRSTTPSNRDPSVSDYSENTNESSAKSAGSSLTATYPRRNTNPEKVPPRKAGVKRTPSDSGYAGPASSSCGGSDVEPIYWEISESREAPPKPSPRTKKSHRTPSDATPKSKETAPPQSQTAVPEESPKKKLPEWINTRAPIPSPRGKKQRSLQSLPCVVPDDNNMETMKKKLQMLSREPLPDVAIPQSPPIVKKREEDQFYSGKAASISYGFTPTRAPPPSPPSRVRKASQISLPAAMAAEEAQCRQQKRRSLYVSPDGEVAPEPPSPRRARRRTDPVKVITQRNIQSAVKRLGERVICLTELLAAAGLQEEATKQKIALVGNLLTHLTDAYSSAGGVRVRKPVCDVCAQGSDHSDRTSLSAWKFAQCN